MDNKNVNQHAANNVAIHPIAGGAIVRACCGGPPANGNVAHCHVCLSASAACVAPGCLCKGIHAQAQALAQHPPPHPVHPPQDEKKETDYQGKINEARARIAAINTTLGSLSASVTVLERTQQETNISMKHQLDQIEAIIDLIKLNMETTDATSTKMVGAMK